ncbi:MAG TPA: hypothetical protein VF912_14775 [Anaeromyxobacter sp.]
MPRLEEVKRIDALLAGAPRVGLRPDGERAVAIVARTAHLGTMSVLVGGLYFGAPADALRIWQTLTGASGLALLATEASHSRHWVYQGRGLLAIAHLAAAALLLWPGTAGPTAPVAALVVGAVGSHLPRAIRKWSLRHRRVLE